MFDSLEGEHHTSIIAKICTITDKKDDATKEFELIALRRNDFSISFNLSVATSENPKGFARQLIR